MPRVYLCGAVDKLDDLGVGWREAAAAELEKRGLEAVWPPLLLLLRNGHGTPEIARKSMRTQRRNVVYEDLRTLVGVNGCWHYQLCEEGIGTAAELRVAEWAQIPIMHGNDFEEVAEAWARFFAAAKGSEH
jgi:hypothetical protein